MDRKKIESMLDEAKKFTGLRNGHVIKELEIIASVISTIENSEKIDKVVEGQDKICKLLENILAELKNPTAKKTTTTTTTTKK